MIECPSRFTLVQFFSNDLRDDEKTAVEAHLKKCVQCRKTIDTIKENNRIYQEHAKDDLDKLKTRLQNEPVQIVLQPKNTLKYVLAVAAVLFIGTTVAIYNSATNTGGSLNKNRSEYKGSFAFKIIAKRENSQFPVVDGSKLKAGDALRFSVTTSGSGYLLILSSDSSQQQSVIYPGHTDTLKGNTFNDLLKIDGDGYHVLDGSIILDDSRGFEHIIVIFSSKPFNASELKNSINDIIDGNPVKYNNISVEVVKIEKI